MNIKELKSTLQQVKLGANERLVFGFAVAMTIFGIIMIFDASIYRAYIYFDNQYYFFIQQVIWIVLALIPAVVIYFWDYRKMAKLAIPALLFNIFLLVLVLIIGDEIFGAKRWINLFGIPIQPAEFVKPLFIVYISAWLAKERAIYHNMADALKMGFGKKIAQFTIMMGLISLLVLLEPDLGTTVIIAATSYALFFISSSDKIHRIGSIMVVIIFLGLGVFGAILEPYRLNRIATWTHLITTGEVEEPNDRDRQINQILIGIGSGGVFGRGFGESRQKYGYLPENIGHTDSISAVVLEEFGMLGGILLIVSWFIFLFGGLKISRSAPDKQGQLIAFGITIWLTLQAFLHTAANVALIPFTGIPMPFLTYGGSSTIVTLCAIALLLNIAKMSGTSNKVKRRRYVIAN